MNLASQRLPVSRGPYQLHAEVIPGYIRRRGQPGRIGARRLCDDDNTEFTMITVWDGLESIIAFVTQTRPHRPLARPGCAR